MTHLFGADALAQKRTTQGIGTRGTVICARTSNVLASLTSNKIILKHSALIASMTTKQGGLGIQHPRSTVILSYFLTMRCNIQYATEGIWASNHTQPIVLPEHLRSLHKNWQDSPLPSLTPFGKHYQDFNSICMHQWTDTRPGFLFLLRSLTGGCKEQIKIVTSKRLKIYFVLSSSLIKMWWLCSNEKICWSQTNMKNLWQY